MASLDELPFRYRAFLRAYPWRRVDPVPWTPLAKPLSARRLALVSSAGLVLPDQEPFDEGIRGGDTSYRRIPSGTNPAVLRETHKSDAWDHAGVARDANLAFPLDRARELVERGRVGSLATHHLSFMGSITAPGRLVRDTAPAAAAELVRDGVDVALLVPV